LTPALRGAALALALAAAPASAYVREATGAGDRCLWLGRGGPPRWAPERVWWLGGRSLTWTLSTRHQPSGCATFAEVQALVRGAFAQWSGATRSGEAQPCTDLDLVEGPTTDAFAIGQDEQNLLVWRSGNCADVAPAGDPCLTEGGCGNRYNCWEAENPDHGVNVLALTWLIYDTRSGEILDADMELHDTGAANLAAGAYYTCTPQAWTAPASPCPRPFFGRTDCTWVDVGNTVTHEVGHIVGLDHVAEPAATMAATAQPGEVSKRQLHGDDVAGVCAIYPRGQATATCYAPPGGCGCGGGPAGALLPLLAPLPWWRRVRKSLRR
jgi:Matrixin